VKSSPQVSIVIPVYNGANYLRNAIDSAIAQTYRNIEVVVINDGSSDSGKTEEIAKSYGDRIEYFYKENGGVASALNFGIRHMTGEYFSWLSHDDMYYPNKIEVQMNFLKKEKECVVLYSDYDFIDNESKLLRTNRIEHIEPENFQRALITDWPIHGCTALVPRKCFDDCGLFDEKLKYTQDYDLWFRIANTFKFKHIPEVLIQSRLHEEQGTVTTDSRLRFESIRLYERFIDQLCKANINSDFKHTLLDLASKLHKKGFSEPAIYALRLSIKELKTDSLCVAIKTYYLFIAYNIYSFFNFTKEKIKTLLDY
jgi:glycosyltransferase involved in cell wall biosynthesis